MPMSHTCDNHPNAQKGKSYWADGKVSACPYHNVQRNTRPLLESAKERKRLDKAAGTIGVDRGGFISG